MPWMVAVLIFYLVIFLFGRKHRKYVGIPLGKNIIKGNVIWFSDSKKFLIIKRPTPETPYYITVRYFSTYPQVIMAFKIGKVKHISLWSKRWFERKLTYFEPDGFREDTVKTEFFRDGKRVKAFIRQLVGEDAKDA